MSLPKIKCEFVGIDIQDDMGRHEVGFVENTVKTPIGIDEEGCLFEARFHVNKVRRERYMNVCHMEKEIKSNDGLFAHHSLCFVPSSWLDEQIMSRVR